MSASEDSPSRIRMAPRSTRAGHSTLADAPVRATKIRDTPAGWRCKPMEAENLRPGARVFGEHAEVRQVRGAGQAGEQHEASE